MKRRSLFFATLVVAAMLSSILMLAPPAVADENAPITLAGCTTSSLQAGDDEFVQAALGFDVNIGDDASVSDIWISENGIVSFDSPIEHWYNGFDLRDVASQFGEFDPVTGSFDYLELIAPFFADAVRDDGGSVTYGQVNYQGRAGFCVEWNDLTPYVPDGGAVLVDPLPTNSFQLLLVDRDDRADDDFDVIINYETIGWDDTYCPQGFFQEFLAEQGEEEAAGPQPGPEFRAEGEPDPNGFNGCCAGEFLEECFFGEVGLQEAGFNAAALDEVLSPVFPDFEAQAAMAGVAFPEDFSGQVVEFPGSGQILQMTDASGLAAKSLNSLQPGRFVVEIRNGFQGEDLGELYGDVTGEGVPLVGSLVSACSAQDAGSRCVTTRTNDEGVYQFGGAPLGDYIVTAHAPPGTDLRTQTVVATVATVFGAVIIDTINLVGPTPPAPNVGLSPIRNNGNGISVYFGEDLDLSYTGCEGGTVTWILVASDGPSPITGELVEGPAGTYTGVIPALRPTHGNATVSISAVCPDPADNEDTSFTMYIDPAGVVQELHSSEPIDGATVILERRGPGEIEFTEVPDGSEIMHESNRENPWTTGADGRFSWDTIPGQYRVTASAPNCAALSLPAEWADRVLTDTAEIEDAPAASLTPILQVEPEWLDLILVLDCNNPPTIEDAAPVTLEAPGSVSNLTPPEIDDLDPTDVPLLVLSSDVTGELPLGDTDIVWTVTDPDGASASTTQTVTVEDTTPPDVTGPSELTVEATSADGASVDYDVTAVDSYEGPLSVTCATLAGGVVIPSVLPLGEHIVLCDAEDSSGNIGSLTTTVSVEDTTAPADLSVTVDGNPESADGEPVVVTFTAEMSDVVDGAIAANCEPESGSLFPVGATEITCEAVDSAGNSSGELTATITVADASDSVPPVVTVPADIVVDAESAAGATVVYDASAVDDVDGDVAVLCSPDSGSLFPVGDTEVRCEASDAADNVGEASFTVTVNEYVDPGGDDIRSSIADVRTALGEVELSSPFERSRVRRAIRRLAAMDADRYWDDGDNLTDRRGYFGANSLRSAIINLSGVNDPAVEALEAELLGHLRQLAQNRLDEAIADSGWPIYIYWAQYRMDRGDQLAANGRTNSAAWYWKSAWLLASWAT